MAAIKGKASVRFATVVFVMGLPFAATAEETTEAKTFSAELSVVSDYIYRGLSLSDGHAAIQVNATWSNGRSSVLPGLHVDGWVSSIDFGPGDPADAEVTGTIGYGGGDKVTYDVGLAYTLYPGAPNSLHYNYLEMYGSVGTTIDKASVNASVHFSPDYSGGVGAATFFELGGEYPVTEWLALVGSVGYADQKPAAGGNYGYWGAGVKASYAGFTASVRYYGNDLSSCAGSCRDGVVASLSRAF